MIRDYATAMMQPIHDSETTEWLAVARRRPAVRGLARLAVPGQGLPRLPPGRAAGLVVHAGGQHVRLVGVLRADGRRHVPRRAAPQHAGKLRLRAHRQPHGRERRGGICTVRLPDVVVDCFTMNAQSIDGALSVAKSIARQRGDRPVRLLPGADAGRGRRAGQAGGRPRLRPPELRALPRPPLARGGRAVLGRRRDPVQAVLRVRGDPAAFGDRSRQENSLLAAYERLAKVVTDGDVEQLSPLDERVRRRWLAEFERRRTAGTSDVFISYAAVDRMWAEWISGELDDAGLRVAMREVDFPADSDTGGDVPALLADATRAIVLLSQDYVQSPNAAELWKLLASRDPVGGAPFLVPVRLDNVRVGPPFHDRVPVDLAGLTEQRAREALLEALDQPVYPRPASPAQDDGGTPRRRFPALEPPLWSVPQRNGTFTGRAPHAGGAAQPPLRHRHGGGAAGAARPRRRGQDPDRAGVRAPLPRRLRRGVVGLRRADQRRPLVAGRTSPSSSACPTGDSVTERVRAGAGGAAPGAAAPAVAARSSTTPTTRPSSASTSRRAPATCSSPPATRRGRARRTSSRSASSTARRASPSCTGGSRTWPTPTPTSSPNGSATCRSPSSRPAPGWPPPRCRSRTTWSCWRRSRCGCSRRSRPPTTRTAPPQPWLVSLDSLRAPQPRRRQAPGGLRVLRARADPGLARLQ